jgi:hypothetical protein
LADLVRDSAGNGRARISDRRIEGWRISEGLYFTFVTGLTIGYGDLTPRHFASRCLAIIIGFSGIVLTGLLAAVSVKALDATARASDDA